MQYPEEFKQKILSTLGENEEMRKSLDEGEEIVGRYLYDSKSSISPQEIIEACESSNIQGIYQKAKRQLAIEELYSEWLELYRSQQQRMHR